LDVCSESDWEHAWSTAETTFDRQVQLLINNAGATPGAVGWRACIDITFVGTAIGTYLALDKMSKVNVRTSLIVLFFFLNIRT